MILIIRAAFDRNQVVLANPSKSGGDWWYGSLVKGSAAGFFPNTYVQKYETCRISLQIITCVYPADLPLSPANAKALYSYAASNADELSFEEGDDLAIVGKVDADWWETEKDGAVFVVPAAYLEMVEG